MSDTPTIEKRCSRCKSSKPLSCFGRNGSSADGIHYYCRTCLTKIAAKYRNSDKGKITMSLKRSRFRARRPFASILSEARRRADTAGIPFSLKETDLEMPTHCPILGIPIQAIPASGRTDNSPSLDRKIPELGYTAGNVVVISWRANRIKSNATASELVKIASYQVACVSEFLDRESTMLARDGK